MRTVVLLARAGVVLFFCAAWVHAAALPRPFLDALQAADIPLESVALIVQPVTRNTPLLAHRAAAAMNPASVMKLLPTLAALDRLGPAFTWKTELWAQGPLQGRVLEGDLIIKGYGDPTLTLERLWLMQRAIRARGIDAIHGNLVLDSGYFALPALDPAAFDGDPLAIYNALPGALLANFNATPLDLDMAGDAVAVTAALALPGLVVRSRLLPDDTACNDWQARMQVRRGGRADPELILEGAYPRACGRQQLNLNVYAPAEHFDRVFRALWIGSGGVLTGDTLHGDAPAVAPLLRFDSIPLAEALRSQNKYSSNLIARNVYLTLGAETAGAPATLPKAEAALRRWLSDQGIAAPELVLENGAGLSRNERISASTLSDLLMKAAAGPLFSEFESSLPLLGVDGTLRRRLANSALTGRAHLKTGTLKDVRALAGYVMNQQGERVVLVLLINHPHADRAEAAQRALLEWTYAAPVDAPAQ